MDHPSFTFFTVIVDLYTFLIPTMLCIFIFLWHTPSLSTPNAADIDYHKPTRTSEATCMLCPCQHPVHIHLAAPVSLSLSRILK